MRLQATVDRQSSAFIRACCPTCIDSHPVDLPLAVARSSVEEREKKEGGEGVSGGSVSHTGIARALSFMRDKI